MIITAPHILSLLIVFIATLIIWKVVEKRQMVAKRKQGEERTCGNEKKKWTQAVLISLLVTYIFFILLITLIARTPADTRNIKLIPFWSWYEVIVNHSANRSYSTSLAVEIILNVVLFVPVGVLLRLLGVRMKCVLLFSLFFSLSIELTQYFTCRGLCEIFDDVIGNTVGRVIGYGICGYVVRICVEMRYNPSAKKQ